MPKLKLLILDAGVVIRLHELGIWSQVLNQCEIYLSRIVAEKEVRYQQGDEYDEDIDLSPDINGGKVQVFDVTVSELRDFRNSFDSGTSTRFAVSFGTIEAVISELSRQWIVNARSSAPLGTAVFAPRSC